MACVSLQQAANSNSPRDCGVLHRKFGNSGIRSSHSRRSPNSLVVRRSMRRVASSPRAPGGSFARRARCGSSFTLLAAVKAVEAFGAPSGLVPTARWFRLPARFFGAVCWMRLFGGCELGSPELIRSGSGSRFPSGCVSVQLVHRRRTAERKKLHVFAARRSCITTDMMSNATPSAAAPSPTAAPTPAAAADGSRAAFLQESADALLSSLVPTGEPPREPPRPQPKPVDAMVMLAQSVMEVQAPRPQFADFATVPAGNPFGAPARIAANPATVRLNSLES